MLIDRSRFAMTRYRQRLTASRYREHVKSFSVSPVIKRAVLVYHYELALPTIATQRAKFFVRHIGIHVTVVHMFQVGTILSKQDQVRIVAYQMFSRTTEIETVDVRVSVH